MSEIWRDEVKQAIAHLAEEDHEPKKRGPKPKYASAAEKQKAYRERTGASVTITLDPEVKAALMDKLKRYQMDKDSEMTLSRYIEHLIKTQVLRKR